MSDHDAGFEILEHTADVGVRAYGPRVEDVFEQATLSLLDITGAARAGSGEVVAVAVDAADLGALLVYWLEEVLYLQDARDSVVRSVAIDRVTETTAEGRVTIAPRDEDLEGTAVKAITYHQLRVERTDAGWVAVVYFDI
ncbi:MAG: archease [Actinomycetota bacterium]